MQPGGGACLRVEGTCPRQDGVGARTWAVTSCWRQHFLRLPWAGPLHRPTLCQVAICQAPSTFAQTDSPCRGPSFPHVPHKTHLLP